MKLFGDVTDHEKSTAEGLTRMEKLLTRKNYSKVNTAKGYIYIVAHWYALGMEEEGNRLLQKIYEICPDYFKEHFKKHIEKNSEFKDLMLNLLTNIAFLVAHKPELYVDVVEKK